MRKRRFEKRKVQIDPYFNSEIVGKFINLIMKKGKKSVAQKIIYSCFRMVSERLKGDPVKIFLKAVDNARPRIAVKPRRIGGATYQVPVEVDEERGYSIAMRWIRDTARAKKGKPMYVKLAEELISAYKGEGSIIKKRDDTHKMAEANKAFAHFKF